MYSMSYVYTVTIYVEFTENYNLSLVKETVAVHDAICVCMHVHSAGSLRKKVSRVDGF